MVDRPASPLSERPDPQQQLRDEEPDGRVSKERDRGERTDVISAGFIKGRNHEWKAHYAKRLRGR